MSITKWEELVLNSDEKVALKALQLRLRDSNIDESQLRIYSVLPEIRTAIVRKAALIYLGYLGCTQASVVSDLKAIATLPINIESMGVHVALANLGDAKSSAVVREVLESEDSFFKNLLSDCIVNCSVLSKAELTPSLIEILLFQESQGRLA